MNRPLVFLLCVIFLGIIAASSTGCTNRRGGTGPINEQPMEVDVNVVPGQVTLSANALLEEGISVSGQRLLLLYFQMSNGTSSGVALSSSSFSVRTSSGLELPILGALDTGGALPECPSNARLASGATVRCEVLLEVAESAEPTTLLYQDPSGAVSETNIPALAPCTRCDGVCTDLMSDPRNCGECGRGAIRCEAGVESGAGPCGENQFRSLTGECIECSSGLCTGTHEYELIIENRETTVYAVYGPPVSCSDACQRIGDECHWTDESEQPAALHYGGAVSLLCDEVPVLYSADRGEFETLFCSCG